MIYTKEKIYNLTLSALLLSREVANVLTDTSNEVRILNIHYDVALETTLKDLDLDALSSPVALELIEELSDQSLWKYAYKYPNNCAFFRRIVSTSIVDTEDSHISKRVGVYQGFKAIFTNEYQAYAEIIPNDVSLDLFSAMAGMALVYRLASLSAPLITGKGAKALRTELEQMYIVAKAEAQEDDRAENFNFEADSTRSSWVAARLS